MASGAPPQRDQARAGGTREASDVEPLGLRNSSRPPSEGLFHRLGDAEPDRYPREVLVIYNVSDSAQQDRVIVDATLHPDPSQLTFPYGGGERHAGSKRTLRRAVTSSHTKIPNVILTPGEIADVAAYILSLRDRH